MVQEISTEKNRSYDLNKYSEFESLYQVNRSEVAVLTVTEAVVCYDSLL